MAAAQELIADYGGIVHRFVRGRCIKDSESQDKESI